MSSRILLHAIVMLLTSIVALPLCSFWLGAILSQPMLYAIEENDRPAEPKSPEAWYGQTIRESAWRSPADEQKGFHVPDGFVVELVAAEPDIAKPMNMAFDAKKRLWVTQSVQYPFPAKPDEKGADSIAVLEDRNGDGDYETKRVFADGLNIPIGILPYRDGVIAFSIPNLWFLRDTDGDGICDDRKVILGPFDTTRDTHGMVNALRDGGDGWIYACHGFNNISKLRGTDGHSIELTSGNVFRFRPDGSRVEQYTSGQVNPFGMTRDEFGFWFTADCHSKPITQLLKGGCYPSFGRPDDGLGFLPPMMDHLHGSTAISGIAHVRAGVFPEAYRGNLLSGNVMTCRINRNRVEYRGATAKAIELPDLLTSDDPWFRPVDLQFGPDGALYVADFYNKIIGHYEVPLDHPDRDRTSGRIWRIRPVPTLADNGLRPKATGTDAPTSIANQPPKAVDSDDNAVAILNAPITDPKNTLNAIERLRALEWLGAYGGLESIDAIFLSMASVDASFDPVLKQAHWIAIRDVLARATKTDGKFPLEMLSPMRTQQAEERFQALIKVLKAVRDPAAANWSLQLIELAGRQLPEGWKTAWLQEAILHLATVAHENDIPQILSLLEKTNPDISSRQEQILAIAEAQRTRNGKLSPKLIELGVATLIDAIEPWTKSNSDSVVLHSWHARPLRGKEDRDWPIELRSVDTKSAPAKPTSSPPNGSENPIPFWSSLGLGERYTGTWTSSAWVASESISFWIVGHNGLPSEPDLKNNYVRVLAQNDSTRDWTEVARVYPPRSDIAKWTSLDLNAHQGKSVRLQVVDGDGHDAYAWIGITDVSVPGLARSPLRDRLESLKRIAKCFGPSLGTISDDATRKQVTTAWSALMQSQQLDPSCKASLQKWVLGINYPVISELVDCVIERGWEDLLLGEPQLVTATAKETLPAYRWDWDQLDPRTLLWIAENYCRRSSAAGQEDLGLRWSRHRSSIPLMATLMRKGAMSKEVLRAMPAAWWETLSAEESSLLADLKPQGESDTSRAAIVAAKATAVEALSPDLAVGARVFTERCAACHQLAGQGKVIGPQLDGAITRTIERLCEDILWPNRNVDEAFRLTNILIDGGETVSGLVIDRQTDTLEVVDQTGKSLRIARDEIESEKISKLSLMPGNFEELVTDQELASLLAYLKSHLPPSGKNH
jgi:putative heme-binding domain-containing protein